MFKVLLADDEPLVLIGIQSMLDWSGLGWEVVGTARNGGDALQLIEEKQPDLVVCDIRMPVLDGLELAERCRERDEGLPVFIMLTSYEEFDYVRQSIRLGVLEYLVKMDLTAPALENALGRAEERIRKERALRSPGTGMAHAGGLEQYRERLFLQLYAGLFTSREAFRQACADLGLRFDAPCYAAAIGSLQNRTLTTAQMATLSAGVTTLAAQLLPKYLPCTVTGMDLRHFSVLFPLPAPEGLEERLRPTLEKAGDILYGYFSTRIFWAVGEPVEDILKLHTSQRSAFAALPLLNEGQRTVFCRTQAASSLDYHARRVAQVQEYIRENLNKPLSLNDVAAVFNFSPNYLSQLFAQWGESGFVEFVTATRINAAKDLMASTGLKVYEISERVGFDSAFYFSKVFKKLEGVSPRTYMQRLTLPEAEDRPLRRKD